MLGYIPLSSSVYYLCFVSDYFPLLPLQLSVQLVWHVPLHHFVQLPLHPFVQEFEVHSVDCVAFRLKGVAERRITPIIGRLFLAALLKNSLLVWISLLLFSIGYLALLYPIGCIGSCMVFTILIV